MTHPNSTMVVIALDHADLDEWKDEYLELADTVWPVILTDHGSLARLHGLRVSSFTYTHRATEHPAYERTSGYIQRMLAKVIR